MVYHHISSSYIMVTRLNIQLLISSFLLNLISSNIGWQSLDTIGPQNPLFFSIKKNISIYKCFEMNFVQDFYFFSLPCGLARQLIYTHISMIYIDQPIYLYKLYVYSFFVQEKVFSCFASSTYVVYLYGDGRGVNLTANRKYFTILPNIW